MKEKKGYLGIGLMALAIPMFLETFLKSLMGTVNTFILGQYSDNAVAAVGVANQYMNMVIIVFTVMSSGMGVLLSQNLGAGLKKEASRVCTAAFAINISIGLAVAVVVRLFAPAIIGWMDMEEALIPDAVRYTELMSYSMLMSAITSTISVTFRNYGNARVPMYVMLLTNLLNIAGCYLVVFTPGTLPWEGVEGVAFVRVISEVIGCIIMVWLLILAKFDIDYSDIRHVRPAIAGQILKLGTMTGVEGICYNTASLLTTAMITAFGAEALAAKVYLNNIVYYIYIVGMSIGSASQIIIGRMVGAGEPDRAYKFAWRSWRIGISCNMAFSVLALVLSPWIYGMFTENQVIIDMCCKIMIIDMAIEAGRSFNHNIKSALQGAGYMRNPMIVAGSSIMLINAGMGYVFGVVLGMGLYGIWLAMALDELTRGLFNALFWMKGWWRNSSLVKTDAA